MRFIFSFCFFLLLASPSQAQIVIERTLHQFGDIFSQSNRVVDFSIENRGSKPVTIDHIEGPEELSYLVSNSVILPGQKILLRLKYNPSQLGLFEESVQVFLSASKTPITFTVEGKSHALPYQESLACPNFQTIEENIKIPFEMDVIIYDDETGEPIPNAKVKLYTKGLELKTMTANSNGHLRFNTFLGYYYFIVSAEGYGVKKFDEYVNHHNPDVYVRMSKPSDEEEVPTEEELLAEVPKIENFNPKYKPVILYEEGEEPKDEVSEEAEEVVAVVPEITPPSPKPYNKKDTLAFAYAPVTITRLAPTEAMADIQRPEVIKPGGISLAGTIEREVERADPSQVKRSEAKRDAQEILAEIEAEEAAELARQQAIADSLEAIELARLEEEKRERERVAALEEAKRQRELEEEKREKERVAALEEAKRQRELEQARLAEAERQKKLEEEARLREEILAKERAIAEQKAQEEAIEVVDLTPQLIEIMDEELALPTEEYSANNVVFLVDVSGSMAKDGKMELLKASIIELLSNLRPIDRMSLVSYSTGAEVLLPSTSALNQDSIIKILMSLEAGGASAGKKGLKVAYKEARKNFIKDGNNMVIIATDGGFDDLDGMRLTVSRGRMSDIKLSVIGLRNRDKTVGSMKKLAEMGKGNYIHINSFSDSKTYLLEEIKFHSKIKP